MAFTENPNKKDIFIYYGEDDPNNAFALGTAFEFTTSKGNRDASEYLVKNARVKVEKRSSLPEFIALLKTCAVGLAIFDLGFGKTGRDGRDRAGEYGKNGQVQYAGVHGLIDLLVSFLEQGKNFPHPVLVHSANAEGFPKYLESYLNNPRAEAAKEELRIKEKVAFEVLLNDGLWRGEAPKPFEVDFATPIVTALLDENPFWVSGSDGMKSQSLEVYSQGDLTKYEQRVKDFKKTLKMD